MNALLFLLPAFAACLVLTGIHTYLGIHVISRGVIFVDIALAQIAALGMTVAFLIGLPPDSQTAYFFTLGFTFLGALFFAYFRDKKIPQEAIIGVSFAMSSALAILLSDKIPHGSEHLKYILAGNILWVSWAQILKTAVIYLILGIFHFLVRGKLILISTKPEEAEQRGLKVWFWDLVFYLSFGLVITSSVQIGGILLVFSFLIVPALCSFLFFDSLRMRIFLGWILGTITSLAGITASYLWDLPTGPTIVVGFGLTLLLSFLLKACRSRSLSE
ncbi:MAG: metal ABC transporter permease [Deltaproteobacteria bacterium]|nr:metal ABC transporter permease [Deltaproteobacteria bacterium]